MVMNKFKNIKRYIFDNEPLKNGMKFDSLLLILTIISSLTVFYLDRNLNFPSIIKIFVDIFSIIILVKIIYYYFQKKIKLNVPAYLCLVFLFISIIGFILNKYSIIQFAIVFEFDYFRFLVVYLGVVYLDIKKEDIWNVIKYLNIFLLIQVPIVIFQYIRFKPHWKWEYGIMQDYLSGLLGGKSTGELGAYICIAIISYYVLYRYGKISLKFFIMYTVALLFVVIIAEIKFVLIILPILLAITYVKGTGKKQIFTILIGICVLLIGMNFTGKLYPEFKDLLKIENMKVYLDSNYAESNLSRLNSVSTANKVISKKNTTRIFGVGIGNTDQDGINASEFASNNIYLFKMFTWSYILAETGYIGTFIILMIYGVNIYYCIRIIRSKNEFNEIIGTIGITTIILFIILNFYCMAMLKINFAILAWMGLGGISRLYFDEQKIA